MAEDQPLVKVRVLLLSAHAVGQELDPATLSAAGVECLAVASGYEAAAEILADPPAAVVVDLRVLGVRNLRLLELAARKGVELLGVGSLPPGLSAEDLSGVRLLSRAALVRTLESLAHRSPAEDSGAVVRGAQRSNHADIPTDVADTVPPDALDVVASSLRDSASHGTQPSVFDEDIEQEPRLGEAPLPPSPPVEDELESDLIGRYEADQPPEPAEDEEEADADPAGGAGKLSIPVQPPGEPDVPRIADVLTAEEINALLEDEK